MWRSCAERLRVDHSAYEHLMYIDVRGGDRFAASQGSCGGFLEKLSVATGERTSRCVLPGATTRAEPACVRHIRVDGS